MSLSVAGTVVVVETEVVEVVGDEVVVVVVVGDVVVVVLMMEVVVLVVLQSAWAWQPRHAELPGTLKTCKWTRGHSPGSVRG